MNSQARDRRERQESWPDQGFKNCQTPQKVNFEVISEVTEDESSFEVT